MTFKASPPALAAAQTPGRRLGLLHQTRVMQALARV